MPKLAMIMNQTVVDLSKRDFTEGNAFEDLLSLLRKGTVTRKLDLSAAKFTANQFFEVLSTLATQNTSIVDLNLSTNHLCSDYMNNAGGLLSALLKCNQTIRKLDLTGHSLNDDVIRDLIEGLKQNSTVKELILHNCSLTEESASLVLANSSNLILLDLGSNKNMTPAFLNSSVSVCLKNPNSSLQSLILNHSASMFAVAHVNDLKPFFKALESCTTLTSLSLRCCHLSQQVGEAILQTLTINSTLTSLDLEFSGFGLRDRGNEILISLLPQLKALRHLKLLVRFPVQLYPELVIAMKQNFTLQSFRPMLGNDCGKDAQESIQTILERNVRLHQAKTLICPHAHVPSELLSLALFHLSKSKAGSTATFQVLQRYVAEYV